MLRRLLSLAISTGRGEKFALDSRIPISYLLFFVARKLVALIRGWMRFGFSRRGITLVGRRLILRARGLLTIDGSISIGDECVVDALAIHGIHFGAGVSLGDRVVIRCTGSLRQLGEGLWIGRNVGIGEGTFLGAAGGIRIGDDCILGNWVSFHSENHNSGALETPIRMQGVNRKGIRVGSNCWFGAKVTILDGVSIGPGTIVAAGAVVKSGVYPENAVLAGVPARVIRQRGEGQ